MGHWKKLLFILITIETKKNFVLSRASSSENHVVT